MKADILSNGSIGAVAVVIVEFRTVRSGDQDIEIAVVVGIEARESGTGCCERRRVLPSAICLQIQINLFTVTDQGVDITVIICIRKCCRMGVETG